MNNNTNDQLLAKIIEGIEEVKGEKITILDLRAIDTAVCDYFVIAEAQSNTQVNAMNRSVQKVVSKATHEKPWHTEGAENAEWILMDYISIVVHLFKRETRELYDIEGLWGDAKVTQIN